MAISKEIEPNLDAQSTDGDVRKPADLAVRILLGLIPFLAGPILTILFSGIVKVPAFITVDSIGYWILLVVLAIMAILIASWRQAFPDWSIPYWSTFLVFTLLMSVMTTPGLTLFGKEIFGSHIWGPLAYIPLMIVALVSVLLTRSLEPVTQFMRRISKDWTLVSFAIYAMIPIFLWMTFDEMHNEEYFVAGMQLILAMGAMFYLILSRPAYKIMALITALAFAWIPSTIYIYEYWNGRFVQGVGVISGSGNIVGGAIALAFQVLILVLPGIASAVVHKFSGPGRSTPPPAPAG